MAQSRIDAFTVSRTAALTERAHKLERLHELEAQRRRIAEASYLEWPQARSKRRVGKPSRQRKWTDALHDISPLTDLCLLVPHCRSFLHGGNLVALCLQDLEHWPTM